MFSTKIRVAFSVLVIRTVSASAFALSASALAFRTVALSVMTPTTRARKPPPRNMFRISLNVIAIRIIGYWLMPMDFSQAETSKLGQAFIHSYGSIMPLPLRSGERSRWPIILTPGNRRWKSRT